MPVQLVGFLRGEKHGYDGHTSSSRSRGHKAEPYIALRSTIDGHPHPAASHLSV